MSHRTKGYSRSRKTARKELSDGFRPFPIGSSELGARWFCALAILLSLLVYMRSVGFPFVYDDLGQIVSNPRVHSWHYFPQYFNHNLWVQLGDNVPSNYYRPLFLVWMLVNHTFFGLEPAGWHIAAMLLHAMVTWVVYVMAGRALNDKLAGGIAAMIFAVHPIHVEAVTWVSGINEPLFALFALLTVLCYTRWREAGRPGWLVLSLAVFSLSLLSKETAVILPAIILFYEWRRTVGNELAVRARRTLMVAAPYVGLVLLYLAIRAVALKGMAPGIGNHASMESVLLTIPAAAWFYLSELVWPSSLSVFYGLSFVAHPGLMNFVLPCLGILVVAAGLYLLGRRVAGVTVAVLWLFVPLLPPLLALVRFDARDLVHDRYLYLPSFGFSMLVALLIRRTKLGGRKWLQLPVVQSAVVILLVCALGAATVVQSQYWSSDRAVYTRGVEVAPQNPLALEQLGRLMSHEQDFDSAIQYFNRALQADPDDYRTLMSLGVAETYVGDFDHAIPTLQHAIQLHPNSGMPYFFLGVAQLDKKQLPEAETSFRAAIKLVPGKARQHFALGQVLEEQGKLPEARAEFLAEIAVDPQSKDAPEKVQEIQTRMDALFSSKAPSPR